MIQLPTLPMLEERDKQNTRNVDIDAKQEKTVNEDLAKLTTVAVPSSTSG